ncbi:MAG: efflux RND transporter permease subunit [Desulfobacteraceae bacterium]|nr:efflux RND transporter permease subunit [Desulfobacteraceae bacterium]
MTPVKASLRYPTVTLILAAMAVAVGLHAFRHMPRTEDPSITIRTGLVMALYPGATSEQVEKQVTKTLEKHIFKFPEIRREKTYSTSRPGLVFINVELEESVTNADVLWAKLRDEMNEIRSTELPEGVRGPIVNSDFGDTVAMLLAIHGERYGYRELRDYVDKIQDELRTIREVGKLATYGAQSEQIWITGDLKRLSQYFADPQRVVQALRQQNVIASSGHFEADRAKLPFRASGAFTTEEQIRNVLVDVSRTGQPVYIRDFAEVERRYQDPSFVVRYDGQPGLLLSVEMQKGKNIVELGGRIAEVFDRLKSLLPPDIKIDLIANQPEVVKNRITQLSHEFLLAILSVIMVTIILLPIRVAVIAALAIPITLCTTLGALDAIGITLHQVSIAALIMVLGIVVDDAIVIADNYVELLDRGFPRGEAAWRCVDEVIVPVLAATVTIIFSFLPLLILEGSVGEFIMALPITVTAALSISFIVAVMLTPIFCRFFIRKGLHEANGAKVAAGKKKFSILNLIQALYKVGIAFFMRHKALAMAMGVCAVFAGIVLFRFVPQQFFPSAERNQFVIDVWMGQGTRIEATDAVMRRIEGYMKGRKEIEHFASFVGQSAPRFYYNVNPQQPDGAYGQFIVNTHSEKQTPALVGELRKSLAVLAPEALVIVKELQQGEILEAPVEVRVAGEDMGELKRIGARIEGILLDVPFSEYVHHDYYNDSCMIDVNVDEELANRLGISNASVSKLVAGAFDGGPAGTFWEGDRPVAILLRLAQDSRSTFGNVRDAYVSSQVTRARVPLRAISTLEPEWQTSRIVRRNGVRALTVRSFVQSGHYASELLQAVRPRVEAIPLPSGYKIEFGGEKLNQDETFPRMMVALGISLAAIFLTLLIQFRTLPETLIVMSSIPLALPGAVIGLIITRNPFGFTAFMGLISLCGIVVRNGIILVDYINGKMREGHSLEQAATEAGERRLRPIFLTTMAAAVGVTPMILSGSSLWSPLASVIAIGLVFSMFITLLVVPVLFVLIKSRSGKSGAAAAVALVAALLLAAAPAMAETKRLTLPEAVGLALRGNTALKIARAKVSEKGQKVLSTSADYFPKLSNESSFLGVSDPQLVTIPSGALGNVPGLGPFPLENTSIKQSSSTFFVNNTMITQPLTQLFKIHDATGIARSDRKVAEAEARKAEDEVIFAVHQLYFGLLSARKMKEAAGAGLQASQEYLREAENAVRSKSLLEVGVTESRAAALQSRQALLAAEIQISDLNSEFSELLGLALDTELLPADLAPSECPLESRDYYLQRALSQNPELEAAKATVEKSRGGVSAAYDEYIPDVSLFASYAYQDGAPFVTSNVGTFGLMMSWNFWDWGKRRAVVGERKAQLTQAEENLRRVKDRITVDLDKAYRKIERTKSMVDVAREALALRREMLRLSTNQLKASTTSYAKHAEAAAAAKKAEVDELQARLGYELARAEVDRIAGTFER